MWLVEDTSNPLGGEKGTAQLSVVGATPLWLAAAGADIDLVCFLLSKGADPLLDNRLQYDRADGGGGTGPEQVSHG